MSDQFIGYTVSISCKDGLGIYQGKVSNVNDDNQTLVLQKAFKNGIPCPGSQLVTLNAQTIESIHIIDSGEDTPKPSSIVSVTKPVAKKANKPISVSENLVHNQLVNITSPDVPTASVKPLQSWTVFKESPRKFNLDNSTFQPALFNDVRTTPGSHKNSRRQKWHEKDEACFGAPINYHQLTKEFDFEKNLALFNKQAVFEEINASQKPDVIRQAIKVNRCKPNEVSIIRSRQIFVSQPGQKEYITDDGVIIPSITRALRSQLFHLAEENHFTISRQCEAMGRAVTELAIPLLGTHHRLNPLDTQHRPIVVVMCGLHRAGVMGANAARILSSHGVETVLFLHQTQNFYQNMTNELYLYEHTGNRMTTFLQELPKHGIDLIIMALADEDTPVEIPRSVINWVNSKKVQVLAVNPPSLGTPGIPATCSVLPILPLTNSPDNGKLYLANLGIPMKFFNDINIRYKSPFGHRFTIPLYVCD
uniref:Enhancer of mRNA-decapping protein 3 n=1 Tax=Clastoptera arizonana TaxID=38151 RepID=A0A1B6E627_9HEMI